MIALFNKAIIRALAEVHSATSTWISDTWITRCEKSHPRGDTVWRINDNIHLIKLDPTSWPMLMQEVETQCERYLEGVKNFPESKIQTLHMVTQYKLRAQETPKGN